MKRKSNWTTGKRHTFKRKLTTNTHAKGSYLFYLGIISCYFPKWMFCKNTKKIVVLIQQYLKKRLKDLFYKCSKVKRLNVYLQN